MDTQELKLKCLELATKGTTSVSIGVDSVASMQMKSTLALAQEYYTWVTDMPKQEPVEPVSND
jgi:hypothetical protein